MSKAPKADTASTSASQPQVTWDDSKMASNFANVVNATSSREEVTLFFGTNATWNSSGEDPVVVALSNRIIMTPPAAKRFYVLMTAVLAEHERRYGQIPFGNDTKPSTKI